MGRAGGSGTCQGVSGKVDHPKGAPAQHLAELILVHPLHLPCHVCQHHQHHLRCIFSHLAPLALPPGQDPTAQQAVEGAAVSAVANHCCSGGCRGRGARTGIDVPPQGFCFRTQEGRETLAFKLLGWKPSQALHTYNLHQSSCVGFIVISIKVWNIRHTYVASIDTLSSVIPEQ